uniref:Uncharacterized protein n=1 Tax=Panagrolaimus sp. ES5 TaxID=591445 RepID=A0AC34G451_9BILA
MRNLINNETVLEEIKHENKDEIKEEHDIRCTTFVQPQHECEEDYVEYEEHEISVEESPDDHETLDPVPSTSDAVHIDTASLSKNISPLSGNQVIGGIKKFGDALGMVGHNVKNMFLSPQIYFDKDQGEWECNVINESFALKIWTNSKTGLDVTIFFDNDILEISKGEKVLTGKNDVVISKRNPALLLVNQRKPFYAPATYGIHCEVNRSFNVLNAFRGPGGKGCKKTFHIVVAYPGFMTTS